MRRYAAFLILLTAIQLSSQPTPPARHGAIFGTWSSLRYIPESGDVLGYEVTVIPQYITTYVIFQCADGGLDAPVFVPANTSATTVSFTVSESLSPNCAGSYTGTVMKKGLDLHFADNSELLSSRKSYWTR